MFNAKSLLDALVAAGSQAASGAGQQQGGIGGMLGNLAQQAQSGMASGGGIGGIVGQVLQQATQGLQQAGRDTGVTQYADQTVQQASGGQGINDLLNQAKGMLGENQLASGAVIGALGGLLFGTSAGRSVATSAAKLGGLALIGGLAYKAYQNYAAGKPLVAMDKAVLPAPAGSGFEAEAATDETAIVFIRAMIAASAADGHIDDKERSVILGGLKAAGFDPEANTWLENEMTNPASIEDLVASASSSEVASQIYTAARLAINPDTRAEKDFLAGLAGSLDLDAELVANIDAAALSAKV
jgi:uncharacterized membrane protein YebE (DUF533 family)